MRYYKELNKKGWITAIGAGDALNGIEITPEEYETLLVEIEAKGEYVDRVYRQEITISEVPAEWCEEVQARVGELVAAYGDYDPDQISDEEALAIIQGVSEE